MAQATRQESGDRRRNTKKDDVIQIRASAETKAVLSRAAALRGQTLSTFVLHSARRQAEETILDQHSFFLDDGAHKKFLTLLDSPAAPSQELRDLMRRKPAWER